MSSKKYGQGNTQRGVYFDLTEIFDRLNGQYFANTIKASLRWGIRRNAAGRQASVRLGSYYSKEQLITISPVLDQAMVPLIYLERVLFHEMNHQHCPSRLLPSGKNQFHTPEFYAFEKNYPHLGQADLWFKANLPRLLKK